MACGITSCSLSDLRRAREALSVVLRVVALAVAPSIVNMVNEHEDSGDDFILTG